jgi:DNA-binding NarL/FixJ family response regulator
LLIDAFTAGMSHLDLMREVRTCVPGIKLVMIGMDEDEQEFLQAIREGAVGYILKDASALEVVSAVRSVVNGEAVCPPSMTAVLFACVSRHLDQLPNYRIRTGLGLTSREQQLVLLIGRGLSNKEIALQLQLAEQTVRNHVHRVLRKLGAENRFVAVEMCRTQGLPV